MKIRIIAGFLVVMGLGIAAAHAAEPARDCSKAKPDVRCGQGAECYEGEGGCVCQDDLQNDRACS